MNKKNIFEFLIVEVLLIIFNIISYNILSTFFVSIIASLISLFLVILLGFLVYSKSVFKVKVSITTILQYMLICLILRILKLFFYSVFTGGLVGSANIAQIASNFVYIIFSLILKFSCFDSKLDNSFINKIKNNCKYLNNIWHKLINLKYIRNIFKFLPHNIIIFMFLILNIYFMLSFFRTNDDIILYSQPISDDNIGPLINKSVKIDFNDISIDTSVDKICLPFGTYQRINNSNLKFELYNQNDEIVYNSKINTNKLNDGEQFCFKVDNISKNNIDEYYLKIISSNANKENNITLFKNSKTDKYTITLMKTHNLFSLKYLFMFLFLIVFLSINYFINNRKIKPHYFFIILLIYIIPIVFIYPPFEIPDEPSHYYTANNLSQNGINADKTVLLNVPKNYNCLNYANIQARDMVTKLNNINNCMVGAKNTKVTTMFGVSNYVYGSFSGFIFSAIGIKFADLISNSPLLIFYLGRVFNLAFALFIVYKTIKITPCYNKILLFLATIPMFLQQICSYSYDAVLNPICLLFVVYCLKIIHNKDKFSFKYKITFLIMMLFILSIKSIYLPIVILLFFIPKESFGGKKEKTINLIILFIMAFLINGIIKNFIFTSTTGIIQGSGTKQLQYIINNPLDLINIIINTFKLNGNFYLEGIFGYYSWFKFHMWDLSVYFYICIFILLICSEKNILTININRKKLIQRKLLMIFSFLITVAAIFGSMYICWSEYKLNYVDGVQGRYFLPLLSLLALIFIPKKEKIEFDCCTLYTFINLTLLIYVLMLIIQFY